ESVNAALEVRNANMALFSLRTWDGFGRLGADVPDSRTVGGSNRWARGREEEGASLQAAAARPPWCYATIVFPLALSNLRCEYLSYSTAEGELTRSYG